MSFALLLTALSDGKSRHVTELAQIAQTTPAQLNGLWQQAPQYLHNLLRQNDGYWKLAKAIALLPENTRHPLFDVQVQPETTSTNTLLLDDARSGCSIHQRVIAAHTQNAGRGQQGKSWHNQLGECLMFSVGWTFSQTQAELGALSLVVALACQRALSQLGCAAQIKWSNDLVIGMDKLGGILIETVRHNNQTHAVIGIGINFLVPEHVDNSTSFQAASNEKHSAAEVFTVLLNVLHQHLTQFAQTGFAPFQVAYEAAHRDQNQTVYLLRGEQIAQYGYALGVTERGELRLQTDYGGVQYIASGEVSLRR
ncbi:MAG: biotin--[acetyl-CoA-carboxylase] ligase, partial [Kingella sp. (in: b-proteobacteria)]